MNERKGILWLLAVALGAASCSIPRTHYYLMGYPRTPPVLTPSMVSYIAVQRFQANQVIADDRIAFRLNVNEVNYYEYHRWAAPPEDLVTNYFIRRLRDSESYAGVSRYKEGPEADVILQGRIRQFEEVDRGKEVSASVELELELVNGKTRAPIWRGEAECSKPLATRDVPGVTQGIQACLDETASKLLGEMHRHTETSAAR